MDMIRFRKELLTFLSIFVRMIRKVLYILLCLFLGTEIFAAQCNVSGVVKNAEGKTLQLKTFVDGILYRDSVLAVSAVENDTFHFQFQQNETRCIFIDEGFYRVLFYLSPGDETFIYLPDYQYIDEAQRMNPFFRQQQVCPKFKMQNLTADIIAYDDAFDYFYSKNSIRPNADSIKSAVLFLDSAFSVNNDVFFDHYKSFQKIQLWNLLPKSSPDLAISEFKKLPIELSNPAFWEAFNNVFDSFFTAFAGKEEQLYIDRAILEQNFAAMDAILQYRFAIDDSLFRELIVVKSLYDLYFSNERSAFVFRLMQQWLPSLQNDYTRLLLANIIDKVRKNQLTEEASPFSLPDGQGETVNLSDFRGKYVLLDFCSMKIAASKRNLALVKRYAETYGKELVALNIFTEPLTDAQKSALAKQYAVKGGNCLLLFADAEILDGYDVKNLPAYFLLDRDGRFALTDFSFEDRFEQLFVEILQKEERGKLQQPKEGVDEWWK